MKYIRNSKGQFVEGFIPWNKNKTGYKTKPASAERKKKVSQAMKGKKGHPAWNKGLHWSKETRKKLRVSHLGRVPWNKGKTYKNPKVSKTNKGKHFSPKTEIKRGGHFSKATEFKKGCKGKKGKENHFWKGGKPKCIECGENIGYQMKRCRSCASKERGIEKLYNYLAQKKSTSIERKVYRELKDRGLLFKTQKLINGKFIVDAYIPSLNLIIEADGDYWHSLDKVKNKDRAENAYLTKCGFNLLRLTETEINNGSFRRKLQNA